MAVKTLDFPMCSFLNQNLPLKQLFAADDSTGGLDKLEVPQICGRACRIFSGRASTERAQIGAPSLTEHEITTFTTGRSVLYSFLYCGRGRRHVGGRGEGDIWV